MSTPTPDTPSLKVDLQLHLEHMDLRFTLVNGEVVIAAPDFVQLMSSASPQHAGLFDDTLKQVRELTAEHREVLMAGDGAAAKARRQIAAALADLNKLHDALTRAINDVYSELARLTARPFPDDDDDSEAPCLSTAQPLATPPAAPAPVSSAEPLPIAALAPPAAESPAAAPAPAADATAAAAPTTPTNT